MPTLPDESTGTLSALTVQLQVVTQALAAAQTQSEVLDIVLRPALKALGAIAGAVLLIDQEGQVLRLAGHLGYDLGSAVLWQDSPTDTGTPATDVLQTREAHYFEHAGALTAAYPDLEARTGAVAAVASAVLPMFLDGRPLGTLVLDFKAPHTFTPEERSFLRTLAAHCTIALDRAGNLHLLAQRLEERTRRSLEDARAQQAFVAFTEAVGSETDLPVLIRHAITVLQNHFPGITVAYYQKEDRLWKARFWSDDMNPELAAFISAGLPLETPIFAQVVQTRQPVFTDGWNADQEGVALSGAYGAAANYPLIVNGELHWLLSVGLKSALKWSEAQRGLVRAIGRGLNLALERAQTAQQWMLQNAELQARTRALEAFANLTRDLALTTEPLLLIGRAQQMVMSMLADGAMMYYEPDGERWYCRVQHGTLHAPELQAAIDTGLPYAETRSLLIPWTTGQPYFQTVYDHTLDQTAPLTGHIAASATLPLRIGGQMIGVLAIALFHQRSWSSVDRVLLETAVQSLELALDRAAKTRTLDEERVALEAFTRFTQQVGSETDVQVLVRQAITLLEETCGADVVYLKREGELFKAKMSSPLFDPALLSRLQDGFPLKQSSLALILRDNTPAFIDHWDAEAQWILESVHFHAVAGYPFFQGLEMQSVLIVGLRTSAVWTDRNKGIFRAVGRSLNLALDRAQQTQILREQRDALAARTQELAVATEELEAFSYSVSHDLRTPVRHMLGFLQLARKSLEGKLDTRSARYLDVVEQSGGQMNALIDALLHLSSATQQPLRPTVVDLNKVMLEIQNTLMPDLLARNIEWEVAPLPPVWGDAAALKQVLIQLTENALKFTHSRDPAVIKVYAVDQDDAWGIFVQDNGLGFDPRYQDRLFNLFQRLHTAQEATGTGVGLASVRRLILKHGGQVFADGRVGEGATFGFSLTKHSVSQSP
ncbi:GAF domain-containing protein [Deinococcus sp. Arct2-2]|uniref:GAF domain-containing protein n=1 Tax=Deinococcus sp. Arct2-2 TaxID=2568653 RepID=UPI0010A33DD8|nr:GAF domain-containing protein [Deinococcus sp. Arct2-2]THF69736.1 GAF domain-containing protein [Deinococcus sp. Arct2-2]